MTSEQAKTNAKTKNYEEIVAKFQTLRNEQRNLVTHLGTLETDLKEHKSVIDTLKTVDEGRKCFRLVGGVLCERTVKEVLPQLIENRDKLDKLIGVVTDQLTAKGQEINKFRDEHNIKFQGEESIAPTSTIESEASKSESPANRNVLVVNN